MSLAKAYEPNQYEPNIYALWEQGGAFTPTGQGEAYTIVMPPPNANGNLHMGHALTVGLEDICVRYQRMQGRPALLLPGADHAGFETQAVYEKQLAKEGKSRFDFSREEIYGLIYDFVSANRNNFESQFRRLGVSADWDKFTYTLDEKIVSQAYATFKKMWEDGLIYRGERLVNFCTFHGTGFADIEVEYKPAKTKLWYIRYPLVDGSGEVIVATTRPETMLGDTGVAVHPDDERYERYVGKTVRLPLTGREVPIVADEFVELEFGTGAVKLTPAHDQNDFDAAERHSLPKISVITHEGKISGDVVEKYRGLDVTEARQAVVNDLKDGDFLVKEESLDHNVGHCYKCGTVIEPLLREQWFVSMKPLAAKAIEALQSDKIRFYPEGKRDQLISYLKGLRDWNISRQIAWGIPIPAFQNVDEPDEWIFNDNVQHEVISLNGKVYHRDPDVFDTWFSSSSWPYATLGLGSDDFERHYPLNLMETGGEILYPWVSRMIMLGIYITGDIPFREVYIHGYVMAEDGSKMSKSVGNVVDPMPVVDQHGSDALRMGIISGRSPGVNRGYDSRRVEEARNFCNKLWNIARYAEGVAEPEIFNTSQTADPKTDADHWVLQKLNEAIKKISDDLDNYRFSEAYDKLYHFVWDELADWYIEASKSQQSRGVLVYTLRQTLKLAHPFAPFATEAIWQSLFSGGDSANMLIVSKWPEEMKTDYKAIERFEDVRSVVSESRTIIKTLSLRKPVLYYKDVPFLDANATLLSSMAGLSAVTQVESGNGLHLTGAPFDCWLDISPEIAASYIAKLDKEKAATERLIASFEARLANQAYIKGAPRKVVNQTKEQLAVARDTAERIAKEQVRYASLGR